jgi:uncharacterized protein (DUF2336 family)
MSQFAAVEQAGGPASPSRGKPPRRGTPSAFRLLSQKLASTSIMPLLARIEAQEHTVAPAPLRPLVEPVVAAPEPQAEAAPASSPALNLAADADPLPDEPPGAIEAFDLGGASGASVEVDLSALEELPAEHRLLGLERHLPGPDEQKPSLADVISGVSVLTEADLLKPPASDEEDRQEQEPPAAPNLRLLTEPFLPPTDEFSAADVDRYFAPAPAEADPDPGPAHESEADETARSPDYRFWEAAKEESSEATELAPLAAAEPVPDEPIEAPAEQLSKATLRPAEARRRATLLRQASGEPSAEAGEVAHSLLEIMSLPANTTQPQERALAADSLLHLVHRLPVKTLTVMAERLSMMETPPPLILAELIHDQRIEVAGPLLEKCPAINDHDLIEVIADGHPQSNRMIARRRSLTSVLCDALIATEDASTVLTLVRNPGALISHEAFFRLNDLARKHHSLQAPLATRSDLPAPVAFELFWFLPPELRRYVISRFLTDSSTLNRILKLTRRMDSDQDEAASDRLAKREDVDRLADVLVAGDHIEAERQLAHLLALDPSTARRILSDHGGEPLTVALKALGATRARFEEVLSAVHGQNAGRLQSFFDSLSFNKARVLLTYWDWAVSRTGPYALLSS